MDSEQCGTSIDFGTRGISCDACDGPNKLSDKEFQGLSTMLIDEVVVMQFAVTTDAMEFSLLSMLFAV